MNPSSITIPVKIDGKIFRAFAVFDTLKRQKRWKSPVIFTGILTFFACLCFALHQRAEQALFMGSVLLSVALIVPGVYFAMFFRSITLQIQKMKLQTPKAVYTVKLEAPPKGITICLEKADAKPFTCSWSDIYRVYRNTDCIYLYTAPNQAFLLPDGQADAGFDTLWEFLAEYAGDDKIVNLN